MLRTPIPDAGERREWPRYRVTSDLPLSVEADGQQYRCALENLSLGGARLSFPDNAIPDKAKLRLRLPDIGLVRMERRWQDGTRLGVLFDYSEASFAFVQTCLKDAMTADGSLPEVNG